MDEENRDGDVGEAPVRNEGVVCISCGSPVESGRRRCPECGMPQRRLWISRRRIPVGPAIAATVIMLLLMTGLAWMMLGDRKAGPARALDAYRSAVLSRDCPRVYGALSAAGGAAYGDPDAACREAYAYDWGAVEVKAVKVEGGSSAVICFARPSASGISLRKEGGGWHLDSAVPTAHEECIAAL